MQIDIDNWYATTRVHARVRNGPVVPLPGDPSCVWKFRVDCVKITYTADDYGSWVVCNLYDIILHGRQFTQDGVESLKFPSAPAFGWNSDPAWGWLRDLVAELEPVGSPERGCPESFQIAEEES